jgi:hypothetical protein
MGAARRRAPSLGTTVSAMTSLTGVARAYPPSYISTDYCVLSCGRKVPAEVKKVKNLRGVKNLLENDRFSRKFTNPAASEASR